MATTQTKRSGFEGGLWIIPLATTIGAIWTGIIAWKASHSGSTTPGPNGEIIPSDINVGWFQTGWGIFSVGLAVVTIGIIYWMRRER